MATKKAKRATTKGPAGSTGSTQKRGRKPAAQSAAAGTAGSIRSNGNLPSAENLEQAIRTVQSVLPTLHRGKYKNRVPATLQDFPKDFRTWTAFARRQIKTLAKEAQQQPLTMTAGGR